jgi:hypothetical protein
MSSGPEASEPLGGTLPAGSAARPATVHPEPLATNASMHGRPQSPSPSGVREAYWGLGVQRVYAFFESARRSSELKGMLRKSEFTVAVSNQADRLDRRSDRSTAVAVGISPRRLRGHVGGRTAGAPVQQMPRVRAAPRPGTGSSRPYSCARSTGHLRPVGGRWGRASGARGTLDGGGARQPPSRSQRRSPRRAPRARSMAGRRQPRLGATA